MAWLDQFGLADFDTLQQRVTASIAQASPFIAKRVLSIGHNTFEFVVDLFITAYIAFFLIRDGDGVARAVRRAIPLSAEHKQELGDKFTTVIRAMVKGNLVGRLAGSRAGRLWRAGDRPDRQPAAPLARRP